VELQGAEHTEPSNSRVKKGTTRYTSSRQNALTPSVYDEDSKRNLSDAVKLCKYGSSDINPDDLEAPVTTEPQQEGLARGGRIQRGGDPEGDWDCENIWRNYDTTDVVFNFICSMLESLQPEDLQPIMQKYLYNEGEKGDPIQQKCIEELAIFVMCEIKPYLSYVGRTPTDLRILTSLMINVFSGYFNSASLEDFAKGYLYDEANLVYKDKFEEGAVYAQQSGLNSAASFGIESKESVTGLNSAASAAKKKEWINNWIQEWYYPKWKPPTEGAGEELKVAEGKVAPPEGTIAEAVIKNAAQLAKLAEAANEALRIATISAKAAATVALAAAKAKSNASAELADAKVELANADAEADLAIAEAVLANAEAVLADAEEDLAIAEAVLANAEAVLADAEADLAIAEADLAIAEAVLANAEAGQQPVSNSSASSSSSRSQEKAEERKGSNDQRVLVVPEGKTASTIELSNVSNRSVYDGLESKESVAAKQEIKDAAGSGNSSTSVAAAAPASQKRKQAAPNVSAQKAQRRLAEAALIAKRQTALAALEAQRQEEQRRAAALDARRKEERTRKIKEQREAEIKAAINKAHATARRSASPAGSRIAAARAAREKHFKQFREPALLVKGGARRKTSKQRRNKTRKASNTIRSRRTRRRRRR
jgi:hypothetical protein